MIVMVPDEFALEFHDFDIGVVYFPDDFGTPVFVYVIQFFFEVYNFHGALLSGGSRGAPTRNNRYDGVECPASDIRARGFGINAQHVFGAGSAHHDPAELANINLDAVDVFAASDGPVENGFQVGVGKIAQLFFFLSVFGVKVDAAVMIFAKFLVQHADEFAEMFTVPGHDFG